MSEKIKMRTRTKGHRKNPQTPLALVLMGKGLHKTMKPVNGPSLSIVPAREPFDPIQSKINKELGYW